MTKTLGWIWFIIVQLIMALATLLGFFALVPFCLARAWTTMQHIGVDEAGADVYLFSKSIKDKRQIDHWNSILLNLVYGNPEDGVSGQYALVWVNGINSPYMPTPGSIAQDRGRFGPLKRGLYASWRAYCWSAWRNSCDNLKYVFAWKNGPQAMIGTKKLGWWPENGYNVPIL